MGSKKAIGVMPFLIIIVKNFRQGPDDGLRLVSRRLDRTDECNFHVRCHWIREGTQYLLVPGVDSSVGDRARDRSPDVMLAHNSTTGVLKLYEEAVRGQLWGERKTCCGSETMVRDGTPRTFPPTTNIFAESGPVSRQTPCWPSFSMLDSPSKPFDSLG